MSSDEALIRAIHAGDEKAAACLYHRHIDRVHRICYRIVLEPSQVNDCVQEVWLRVFRNLKRFQCGKSFSAWLNAVTANTAIDFYRKTVRRGNHIDIDELYGNELVAEERTGDHHLDEVRLHQRICKVLAEISASQRTAFILRYFEDMSTGEIAQILGCNVGTVRTHIRRSLLALREKLAETIKL